MSFARTRSYNRRFPLKQSAAGSGIGGFQGTRIFASSSQNGFPVINWGNASGHSFTQGTPFQDGPIGPFGPPVTFVVFQVSRAELGRLSRIPWGSRFGVDALFPGPNPWCFGWTLPVLHQTAGNLYPTVVAVPGSPVPTPDAIQINIIGDQSAAAYYDGDVVADWEAVLGPNAGAPYPAVLGMSLGTQSQLHPTGYLDTFE